MTDETTSGQPETDEAGGEDREGKYGIRSIGLAMRILESIVLSKAPKAAAEISRELNVNKWKVHRNLHTLRQEGFLYQDPETNKFTIGNRMYNLIESIPMRFPISRVVRPAIEDLARKTGHTVLVSGTDEYGLVIVDSEAAKGSVRLVVSTGTRILMNASAQGKVGLAFGPARYMNLLSGNVLLAPTKFSITDEEQLRAEIDVVRLQGWASAPEETVIGLNFVSVPVMSRSNEFVGALAVVDTIQSLPHRPSEELLRAMRLSADEMAARL